MQTDFVYICFFWFTLSTFRLIVCSSLNLSRLVTKPTKWHVYPAKTHISLGIRPVWSVFAVRLKKAWTLSHPLSAQWRLWSDWANAQADLSLRWAHMPFCWFCHEAVHLNCGMRSLENSTMTTCRLAVRKKKSINTKKNISHVTRKPVFGIFDQVRLKPACSDTEAC